MKRIIIFTLLLITLIAYGQEVSQSHTVHQEQMSFEELQQLFKERSFYKLLGAEKGIADGEIITIAPKKQALKGAIKMRGWIKNLFDPHPKIRKSSSYDIWHPYAQHRIFPNLKLTKRIQKVLKKEINRSYYEVNSLLGYYIAEELGFSAVINEHEFVSSMSMPDVRELMGRINRLNEYLDEKYQIVLGFYTTDGQNSNSIEYLEKFGYEGLLPLASYYLSPEFYEHDINGHVPAVGAVTLKVLRMYQRVALDTLEFIYYLQGLIDHFQSELSKDLGKQKQKILIHKIKRMEKIIEEISARGATYIDASLGNLALKIYATRNQSWQYKVNWIDRMMNNLVPFKMSEMFLSFKTLKVGGFDLLKYLKDFYQTEKGKDIKNRRVLSGTVIDPELIKEARKQISHIKKTIIERSQGE
jgi:hypothetical protein